MFFCKHYCQRRTCPYDNSCGFAHSTKALWLPSNSRYTEVWERQAAKDDRGVDYWVGQQWSSSQKTRFYQYYTLDRSLGNFIPLWAHGAALFYGYEDTDTIWQKDHPWDYGLRSDREYLTEFQLRILHSCEEPNLMERLWTLHQEAKNAYENSMQQRPMTPENDSDQTDECSACDDAMADDCDYDEGQETEDTTDSMEEHENDAAMTDNRCVVSNAVALSPESIPPWRRPSTETLLFKHVHIRGLEVNDPMAPAYINAVLRIKQILVANGRYNASIFDNGISLQLSNMGQDVGDIPLLSIDMQGMAWDGFDTNICECHTSLPDDDRRRYKGISEFRYHGTQFPIDLIRNGGEQTIYRRPLQGKPGWCNYPHNLQDRAWNYAKATLIGTEKFRCVCVYRCRCYKSTQGQRNWQYTPQTCKSYSLHGIHLARACHFPHPTY